MTSLQVKLSKRLVAIRKYAGEENPTFWGHYEKNRGYSNAMRTFLENDKNFELTAEERYKVMESMMNNKLPEFRYEKIECL